MKLSVNLDGLWANVKQMGAEKVDLMTESSWAEPIIIDKEVSLEDIKNNNGLLSVDNGQVLLYIPDHGKWVTSALQIPSKGNKFHIADCKKLQEMRAQGRYNRYMVTNNLSDTFNIYGIDERTQESLSGEVKLHVCKLCLNYLNYKGAANANYNERNQIVSQFDSGEFFSTYSSLFDYMPEGLAGTGTGYTDNWKDLSKKTRRNAQYTCSHCHLDLSTQPELLHVHHANGVKHDNAATNLKVLCCDCHRKEAHHSHLFVPHEDTIKINQLRREQGIIISGYEDWRSAFNYIDPAFHGILNHARKKNYSPPDVGYTLKSPNGQPLAVLDVAWPETKFGMCIEKPESYTDVGWYLLSIKEGMDYFCQ